MIPQLFYDLIARVIPGAVVILTWYVTILSPTKVLQNISSIPEKSTLINFWSFALMIIIAYVVGFILNDLWSMTFRKMNSKKKKRNDKKSLNYAISEYQKIRESFSESELKLNIDDLPEVHEMHNQIRLFSESEGYRLLKLRAEARLCQSLFIGLLLLPIVNMLFWIDSAGNNIFIYDRAILEIITIIALITLWRTGEKLEKYYTGGTSRAWLLLSFPIGRMKDLEFGEGKSK